MGTNKYTNKHTKRLVEQECLAARSLKILKYILNYIIIITRGPMKCGENIEIHATLTLRFNIDNDMQSTV